MLAEPPSIEPAKVSGPRLSCDSFDQLAAYIDGDSETLTPRQRYDCRQRAARVFDEGLPVALAYAERKGVEVRRFSAPQGFVEEMRQDAVLTFTGISDPRSDIIAPGIDAYVPVGSAAMVEALYSLRPAVGSEANVTLRVVEKAPSPVRNLHVVTDLAQDWSSRSREAALQHFESMERACRRKGIV